MSVDTEISTDPTASPLRYFGSEVRLERERLGMTRAELGKIACCSYSLVAKIETGERASTLDFARACDATSRTPPAVSNGSGHWRCGTPSRRGSGLTRSWKWKATVVRTSQPILIPGLAQTPGYARALLRSGRPTNLEDLVTARMERQHVLTREQEPARLWIVMRENVLTNTVGGPQVMRQRQTLGPTPGIGRDAAPPGTDPAREERRLRSREPVEPGVVHRRRRHRARRRIPPGIQPCRSERRRGGSGRL